MKGSAATTIAVVLTPLFPAFATAVLGPLTGNEPSAGWIAFWLLAGYGFGLFGMVTFGLPLYLLVSRLRLVNAWTCIVGGVLVGFVMALLMSWTAQDSLASWLDSAEKVVGLFTAMGACSGLLFWSIRRVISLRSVKATE